ncbi:hypothetical protein ACFW2V_40720 [Streptomyces sp. NPDC058947]|uniref:hypothetical protein n=1 Tax=unclassified Streptomyces TaxID=2593676 RepID=UPI000B8BCB3F|nr:hypothetical protein [Streptomyces sp. XY006]OXS34555.1 hypothetical protein CHR28_14790 [Streptomyces sp. XY006]
MRKTTAALAAAGALALVVTTAQSAAADGHGRGWYGVWANGVNVRSIDGDCIHAPSTTNCPSIIGQLNSWDEVMVYCQVPGQSVGGNPYWLMVQPRGWSQYGIMSSYYVENTTNWIDGVPGIEGCVI